MTVDDLRIDLAPGRYARLEAIEWWDRDRVRGARVLVVGAGALGNEILKNLALLGVGHVVVVDMDVVEKSNLSRAVLLRERDEGASKAERAAAMMRDICPDVQATAVHGNVLAEIGLGHFRWADVVIGALDNREARLFVNAACARVGRTWIDGGIDVLHGIVRVFSPPTTACYECTMSRADWALVVQRRSCSLLARRAAMHQGVPTTPTTASVIGGMQAQEALKMLHGLDTLAGRAFFFDGRAHESYVTSYRIHPDCPWHEAPAPVEAIAELTSDTPFGAIADRARAALGGLDAIDLSRELLRSLRCPTCADVVDVWRPVDLVPAEVVACPRCGAERIPEFCHTLPADGPLAAMTPRTIGLPPWDIVWARVGASAIGFELAGDAPVTAPAGRADAWRDAACR